MERRRYLLEIIRKLFKWVPYPFNYLYHSIIPSTVNKNNELPEEYQEVEYIESSGTQYIDSGYVPNANTKVIFDTMFKEGNVNGIRQGRHGNGERLSIAKFEARAFEFAIGNYEKINDIVSLDERNIYELDVPNGVGKLNGVVKSTFSPITWTSTQTLYFFARNTSSGADGLGNIRNYNIKIYESNVLVRNFIPCYRKSDNVIGLFDVVNQVFYTNAGTGTFLKGNNVTRNVLNKARLKTIEGNSVVENQLVNYSLSALQTINTSGTWNNNVYERNGISFTVGTNEITINGTASGGNVAFILTNEKTSWNNTLVVGCPSGGSTSTYCLKHNYSFTNADIGNGVIATYGQGYFLFYIFEGQSFNNVKFKPRVIDLTQEFPFDTPTTLTDNRVQALINRGYIPYNVGEIKNSVLNDISSKDSNDTTIGTISLPAPLEIAGVGTAHNTFEVLKDSYRFTRNVFDVDLGTLDYTYNSSAITPYFYSTISNAKQGIVGEMPNIMCQMYQPALRQQQAGASISVNKTMTSLLASGGVVMSNSSYTDATTFKTAMSGVPLTYELATPQVINIPKKHLGWVKLKNMNWTYDSASARFVSTSLSALAKGVVNNDTLANFYCSRYLTKTANQTYLGQIGIANTALAYIYVKDSAYTDITNFVNSLTDNDILFYETENETTDFVNETIVESGGTLNTDSNVLPNVEMLLKCK